MKTGTLEVMGIQGCVKSTSVGTFHLNPQEQTDATERSIPVEIRPPENRTLNPIHLKPLNPISPEPYLNQKALQA